MRLFVALALPDAVRERLWKRTARLRRAGLPVRWVGTERLHLTLKFLGEVPEDRLEEVRRALREGAAGRQAPELRVGGLGAFPSLRRPRVLWLGVEPVAALMALQDAVEGALVEAGFPAEGRAFRPHLTLGRVRRRGEVAEGALERLSDRADARAVARPETVDLMESRLGSEGPRYRVVEAAELIVPAEDDAPSGEE